MIEATATEFAKRLGQYRRAAQREPVAVKDRSGITEVLISKADFDEFQRLKSQQRQAIWTADLPDHLYQALLETEMDPRHAHLDALMEE